MTDTLGELLRLCRQVADAREHCENGRYRDRESDAQNLDDALDELCSFYWENCFPG